MGAHPPLVRVKSN